MTEVRPRDRRVCEKCRQRSCVQGTSEAWRCPWLLQPFRLERNNYCGLCMECVKACPNRNLTLNARPFCSDTAIQRADEAWMAFIMIALVVAYSAAHASVFLAAGLFAAFALADASIRQVRKGALTLMMAGTLFTAFAMAFLAFAAVFGSEVAVQLGAGNEEAHRVGVHTRASEGDRLSERGIVTAGLEADLARGTNHVGSGRVVPGCARTTPLHRIAREGVHV